MRVIDELKTGLTLAVSHFLLERKTGFEPATLTLAR